MLSDDVPIDENDRPVPLAAFGAGRVDRIGHRQYFPVRPGAAGAAWRSYTGAEFPRAQLAATEQSSAAKVAEAKTATRPTLALQGTAGYSGGTFANPGIPGLTPNVGGLGNPFRKFSYDVTKKVKAGIEYYGSLGPITGFDPIRDQQQQIIPAIDLDLHEDWEFNFGVGIGVTHGTDHLLVKAIVGRRFNIGPGAHDRIGGGCNGGCRHGCRRSSPDGRLWRRCGWRAGVDQRGSGDGRGSDCQRSRGIAGSRRRCGNV